MTKTAPFDEQANEYDAWFEKDPDLYLAQLEAVRRRLWQRRVRGYSGT
jgi:hypothetical protein